MAITIDWGTRVINVPRADLTLVQSVPVEIREMELNWFHLTLKDLEDTIDGMAYPDTHIHNTTVTLAGLTYARVIEIINNYTVTFEDGQYAVNLTGANSNVGDVVNVNQVSVRSQNSAGLISSPDIEYSSFNGGVMINVDTGVDGTIYPTGTERRKSNNIEDTILIAEYRGFTTIYLDSDITLDATANLNGYKLIGNSHVFSDLVIYEDANVTNIIINNCNISGILDGNNEISGSIVGDVIYFNGQIHGSGLSGEIMLGGNLPAHIGTCTQVQYSELPSINMNGWGHDLNMTEYSGRIEIKNLTGGTGTTFINIGLSQGEVILNSTTVTAGNIIVTGIGDLVDENGNVILSGIWNGGVNISNKLINRSTITEASQLGVTVYVDTVNGVTGTEFPKGSKRTPVNNVDDAILIANDGGVNRITFLSDYTFPDGTFIQDFELEGDGILDTTFTFVSTSSGCVILDCSFYNATLTGNFTGVKAMFNCRLIDLGSIGLAPSSQEIILQNSLIEGIITIPSNFSGKLTVIDSYSNVVGAATPTLDIGNSTANMQMRNYTGGIKMKNISSGNTMSIDLISGQVKLDPATVTNGTIVVRGSGKVVNADTNEFIYTGVWNGGVTVLSEANTPEQTAKIVWDESVGDHLIDGTTGRVMGIIQFGGEIYIDNVYGVTGTTFPIGTENTPVNNLDDAILIAQNNNIKILHFLSNYTLPDGTFIQDYTLKGSGILDTTLTFVSASSGCVILGCSFENATLTGNFTGVKFINNCIVKDLGSIGLAPSSQPFIVQNSLIEGIITIPSNYTGLITVINSFSNISGATTPTLDIGNGGADLQIRGYYGTVTLKNINQGNKIIIDLDSGQVKLDPATVTNGQLLLEVVER